MEKSIANQIEEILQANFCPNYLEVIDESSHHQGHAEAGDANQSHFRVIIASNNFKGLSKLNIHRKINAALKNLMGNPIHALAINVKKTSE